MRGGALRGYLTGAALLASPALASALTPHDKAESVQPHQKADSTIHAQEQAQDDKRSAGEPSPLVTPAQAASQQRDTGQQGESREQEGTEFWPTLLGYKFKITDSLIALSTLVLTVFTGLLWRSTEKLWTAGERQIGLVKESTDLARLALESAETPYLVPIVTHYDATGDKPPPSPSIVPIGSYVFENCGRSPATILEVYRATPADRMLPKLVPFPPPQTNLFHTSILAPGRSSDKVFLTVGHFDDWTPADQTRAAWLVGHVRYADVFGNQFLTGFCFYRNTWGYRWSAVGTPYHNYRRKLTAEELRVANIRDTGLGVSRGYEGTDQP